MVIERAEAVRTRGWRRAQAQNAQRQQRDEKETGICGRRPQPRSEQEGEGGARKRAQKSALTRAAQVAAASTILTCPKTGSEAWRRQTRQASLAPPARLPARRGHARSGARRNLRECQQTSRQTRSRSWWGCWQRTACVRHGLGHCSGWAASTRAPAARTYTVLEAGGWARCPARTWGTRNAWPQPRAPPCAAAALRPQAATLCGPHTGRHAAAAAARGRGQG